MKFCNRAVYDGFEIIAIIAGFLTAGGTGVGVGYLIWGEVNKVQVSEKV